MKKSKKLVALFAAVLMVVTVFSSAIPANAAKHTGTITCGTYKANIQLIAMNISGTAKTTSNKTAENLQAFVVATKVDKNGKQITPDMDSSYCVNGTDSGTAGVGIKVGSSDRYKNITSTHGAKFKGYSEQARNLSESF